MFEVGDVVVSKDGWAKGIITEKRRSLVHKGEWIYEVSGEIFGNINEWIYYPWEIDKLREDVPLKAEDFL